MSLNLLLFTFSERKYKDNLFKVFLATKKPDWMFKICLDFFVGWVWRFIFFTIFHFVIVTLPENLKENLK